jgi:hypothetical protein
MQAKTRAEATFLYRILSNKRALKDLIDYDESFLKSLNDEEFIYLVNFLESYYESPGIHPYRASTGAMRRDALTGASCIRANDTPLDHYIIQSEEVNSEEQIFEIHVKKYDKI